MYFFKTGPKTLSFLFDNCTITYYNIYMAQCLIENCKKEQLSRGLCGMHYRRYQRHGNAEYVNPKCNREPGNKWTKEKARANTTQWKKQNKKIYNAYLAGRKKHIKQATPPWSDTIAIKNIYKNCPEGHQVDHIIPIHNENICGLHVPWNLQYLSEFDNNSKNNKWDGTYDNKNWKGKKTN